MPNSLLNNSLAKIRAIFSKNQDKIKNPKDQLIPMLVNAKGHFCPIDNIKPVDLARHDLVNDIVDKALVIQQTLTDFKEQTASDIAAFVDYSLGEYEVKIGGIKGNLQLLNHDETRKIRIAIADRITFNEKLKGAQQLIEELIQEHSTGLDDVISVLVREAFQVDKEGKIDTAKVLNLRRYKINNEKWQRAMALIDDSISIVGKRRYIQIYRRETPKDAWQSVLLDLAKV